MMSFRQQGRYSFNFLGLASSVNKAGLHSRANLQKKGAFLDRWFSILLTVRMNFRHSMDGSSPSMYRENHWEYQGRRYHRKTDISILRPSSEKKPKRTEDTVKKPQEQISLIQLQESRKVAVNENLNEMNLAAMIKETKKKLADILIFEEMAQKLEKENKLLESLQVWEQHLLLQIDVFGKRDQRVEESCKKFVLFCNSLSMVFKDNTEGSLEILKHSLRYSNYGVEFDNRLKIQSMTLNNISFVFRSKNMYKEALTYAKKAFKIENEIPVEGNEVGLADSHLNVGTILSKLGSHKQALSHANSALEILLDHYETTESSSTISSNKEALYSSIVVAHNNIAVELEHLMEVCWASFFANHLHQLSKSAMFHEKALTISQQKLGPSHAVTIQMQKSFDRFQSEFKEQKKMEELLNEHLRSRLSGNQVSELSSQTDSTSFFSEDFIQHSAENNIPVLDLAKIQPNSKSNTYSDIDTEIENVNPSEDNDLGTSVLLYELNNILNN